MLSHQHQRQLLVLPQQHEHNTESLRQQDPSSVSSKYAAGTAVSWKQQQQDRAGAASSWTLAAAVRSKNGNKIGSSSSSSTRQEQPWE